MCCDANFLIFSRLCQDFFVSLRNKIINMRHRIKSGKIGSFNPERVEVQEELQEEQALSSEVEEIFEEDTAFSDSDEALAAMEFYDTPDEME